MYKPTILVTLCFMFSPTSCSTEPIISAKNTQVDQSDNWVSSDPISILSESDRIISDYIGS